MISAQKFMQATGHLPENDDLDRCNCLLAGSVGHMSCGWDWDADKPMFMSPSGMSKRLGLDTVLTESSPAPITKKPIDKEAQDTVEGRK